HRGGRNAELSAATDRTVKTVGQDFPGEIVFAKNNSGREDPPRITIRGAAFVRSPRVLRACEPEQPGSASGYPTLSASPTRRQTLLQETPTRSGTPSGTVRKWRCTVRGRHVDPLPQWVPFLLRLLA